MRASVHACVFMEVDSVVNKFAFCLQLKVSGNNLINVCKLVFKVSREEKNDVHFLDGNILGNYDNH